MQIKTGLALGAGIAIGYCLFRDANKKEKTILMVKRILYKMQTGKSLDIPAPEPKKYTYTYKDYIQKKGNKDRENN